MQKDTRSAVAEYRGGGYVVRMVLRVPPGDPGPPEAGEVEGLSCCRASGPVYQIGFCRGGVRHMHEVRQRGEVRGGMGETRCR